MKYKDYYKILGVDKTATQDEIKKSYKKLARKFHPDVSKEKDAEDKFKELGEAYEVLKDTEKRASYDQLGSYQAGQEFRPPPDWEQQFGQSNGFGGFGAGGFGDFADLFGMGRQSGRQGRGGFARAGQDFTMALQISLDDAYHGVERTLDIEVPERSPDGQMRRIPKSIKMRIPKGAIDGQKMRLPGKGGAGANGGPNGDLILTLHIQPHTLFKAVVHDLYLDLPVTPWEAALGTSVEVPTMEGKVRLKVSPGAKSGQKLRLTGKGLPKRGGGHGDFFAVLQIVVPTTLTDEETKLFEELAKISAFNPRSHLV
ncbi:DnaJ C-terminal domain-containing protein [Sulfurirhabdus autotrophica]|uniref:Curved DNA-binding protein n=1 Tax=Sulfurirhabdus autotrophica TaxID=1706046 RepID=A0A4R3Y561_9PROT|nr:DnaJ C-terminal domain-containing protein [Sulfurirhabdus autotrophica]TCV86712.1 curved DNA-binding protein [Sulfurirhabdus autotrophica]